MKEVTVIFTRIPPYPNQKLKVGDVHDLKLKVIQPLLDRFGNDVVEELERDMHQSLDTAFQLIMQSDEDGRKGKSLKIVVCSYEESSPNPVDWPPEEGVG